jgi:DNA polymerase/3'-5' exonuclease PolX
VSGGIRASWADGWRVASGLVHGLGTGCDHIEVAGSLRRHVPEVGDIEIVAVPRHRDEAAGLWGEPSRTNELSERIDGLLADGVLAPHPDDPKRGERYSKVVHRASGLQVDVFSARPETLGLILLIRTGPADYSRRVVTDARARGFHVAEGELHRGGLAPATHARCERVSTPGEQAVCDALGIPLLPPERRL